MLDYEGYSKYLELIGIENINTWKGYISENKLDILNQILEYQGLTPEKKLIKFSNETKDFKNVFNQFHSYAKETTFNDLRSGAKRYKYYLQYLSLLKTLKDFDNKDLVFDLNGAYRYFEIFNNGKQYPLKVICRENMQILELESDFTTKQAEEKLERIFNKKPLINIKFLDVLSGEIKNNEISQKAENINMKTKNIMLYGSPGVGKTHNYKRLITMIENGESEKTIFDTISKNETTNDFDNSIFETIKNEKRIEFVTFHQSYSYEDFIEGFRPQKNGIIDREDGIFKLLCEEADKNPSKNFYIVIDEINRGNISKIFGELITLIEEDKRGKEEYRVKLPYSKETFLVPSNLYIIATMNSTDKSIATIDIALRRRFTFLKMKPNLDLVKNENAKDLMQKLNEHISKTISEDYALGHSYFMKIENEDDLKFVKEYKIKPLLEEYFYGDETNYKKALEILE